MTALVVTLLIGGLCGWGISRFIRPGARFVVILVSMAGAVVASTVLPPLGLSPARGLLGAVLTAALGAALGAALWRWSR